MNNIYFDLCGTLYKSNTTFDFIRFYLKTNGRFFKYIYSIFLCSIFAKLLNRLFKFSIRERLIYLLKNESVEDINKSTHLFYEHVLKYKVNIDAMNEFNQHKNDKNNKIIIISASIDPILKIISYHLNVDFISTTLSVDNGYYSGVINTDVKGIKESFVKSTCDYFYTDNLDDFRLCNKSNNVVIYTKDKNKKYWSTIKQNHKGNSFDIRIF